MSAFSFRNFKVLSTCLARGMIFENFGPLRHQKNPPVFGETCRDK